MQGSPTRYRATFKVCSVSYICHYCAVILYCVVACNKESCLINGPLNRYVILWVAHAPGMTGTFSHHRLQRKPLVSDPNTHHGTCVTHVPWCKSGSLTRGGGENVPGILRACTIGNITYLIRGPWSFGWKERNIALDIQRTEWKCWIYQLLFICCVNIVILLNVSNYLHWCVTGFCY